MRYSTFFNKKISPKICKTEIDWANSQLLFGIKLLKGKVCSQTFEHAISDAVSIRWALANAGFWWQAKRLDNWINRARKKGDFL